MSSERKDGLNFFYDEDGNLFQKVEYLNGVPNGLWEEYYPEGGLYISSRVKDGKFNGLTKYFNEDGTLLMEGSYVNEERYGYWVDKWDNGYVFCSGNFINGEPHGYFKSYNYDGTLLKSSYNYIGIEVYQTSNGKLII